MALTTMQIILIAALVVIARLGYTNQRKRLKKKEEESDPFVQPTQESTDTFTNSQIKDYISQNKKSYSRDALKQALTQAGHEEEEIEKYLKEFY